MFTITDWNINPNQDWYVKISDIGSVMSIGLFNSFSDAFNDINLIASGSGSFGENSEITLTMSEEGSPIISLFNPALSYHLKVTGYNSDGTKIYHLFPFVDISAINNSVYRSEDLIQRRVIHEINEHTHAVNSKTLSLATIIDGLEINDILTIDSDFRGSETDNIVEELTLTGTTKSLNCLIKAVEYSDFKRSQL